jgi:hypothetical protein
VFVAKELRVGQMGGGQFRTGPMARPAQGKPEKP